MWGTTEYVTSANKKIGKIMDFFDKHGALAILFAIFLQTSGAIWWASAVNTRVGELSDSQRVQNETIAKLTALVEMNGERLTRVEAVQENVVKVLDQLSQRALRENSAK